MSESKTVWIAKPLADAVGILWSNERRKGRGYQVEVGATEENYAKVTTCSVPGWSNQKANALRELDLAINAPVSEVA